MKKNLLFFVCLILVIGFNYPTSFAQIILPYKQTFDGPTLPPFWTQTSTISPRWSISQTANAGGTPNEAMFTGTTGIGISRLIVGPINTEGFTKLNVQFSLKINCSDTTNLALRIQSSTNGTNWVNEGYNLAENVYNCAQTVNIEILHNLGFTTYISVATIGNHTMYDTLTHFCDEVTISPLYTNDVGILSQPVISPRDPASGLLFPPKVTVYNYGSTTAENFPVQLTITGGYSSTKIVDNLAPGYMRRITFDDWNPIPGIYIMNVCTQLAGDPNPLNDCRTKEVTITNGNAESFQLTVDINDGWNIASIPGLHPANQNIDSWWSGRDQMAGVYKFEDGYQAVTSVEPGTGYWIKHNGSQTYNTGDEWPTEGIKTMLHLPVIVNTGWNLIGGYERSFQTENIFSIPPDIISAPIYEFSGGYQVADSLIPGYGYWVKTSSTGQLMIDTSCTGTPPQSLNKTTKQTELFKKEWGKLIITDAAGQNYTLYAVTTLEDLNRYELPPPPPAEVFDIRYSSGKIAEDLSTSQSIEMNGVVYPVKIKVENMQVKITDAYNSEIDRELNPGEELIIHNNQINKLTVQSSLPNAPVVYSLEQNYPNPFNPSTKISWQAPTDGKQTLKVFDVLGNEVAVLVDEFRPAGRYDATFDAGNLASGIYIYRLQAGEFVQAKKMILLK